MFIVWRGWGFAVVSFAIAGFLIGHLIPDLSPVISVGISLALAAAPTYLLARWRGRTRQRVLVDQETQKKFVLADRSSLFFIPIIYWSYIFLLVAIVLIILGLFAKH